VALAVMWFLIQAGSSAVSSAWHSIGDTRSRHSDPASDTSDAQRAPPTTARGQARALDGLLEQNSGTRSAVADAVQELLACPDVSRPRLSEAAETFTEAAEDRMTQLELLDELGFGMLPDGATLQRDLRESWRASADADRAYAQLADEAWCARGPTISRYWQEAGEANERATEAKRAFVGAWNPIAEQYDLSVLSWDEV
jgi:hypothetical protein